MATELKLTNTPIGYQTLITNGRHGLVGDEPLNSKGTDLGFSPTEFMLAGLAMCKVATVRFIARKNGWDIGNVEGHFSQHVQRLDGGKLRTHVKVTIDIEGDLTDDQRNELLAQADRCYVHRMIEGEWEIENALSSAELLLPSPL